MSQNHLRVFYRMPTFSRYLLILLLSCWEQWAPLELASPVQTANTSNDYGLIDSIYYIHSASDGRTFLRLLWHKFPKRIACNLFHFAISSAFPQFTIHCEKMWVGFLGGHKTYHLKWNLIFEMYSFHLTFCLWYDHISFIS